jgi:hypothetical protein
MIQSKRMRAIPTLQAMAMLFASTISTAATVEYQHPDLTIVARQEPLDTVLKSIGKEMRIFIAVPTGLNLVVNCDIRQQPIQQAFMTMLGDLSYSLEWEKRTGKLVGLTILAGGEGATAANVSADERAALEERMAEEVARHDAELEAGLASAVLQVRE